MTIPLKKLRINKNITQAELSRILNVSPSTIGMWEQGRREPSNDYLRRIANYFNVSTDYLLGKDTSENIHLSKDQEKLLNDYESLSKDGQNLLKALMTSLLLSHSQKSSNVIQKNSGGNNFLNVGGGNNYVTI